MSLASGTRIGPFEIIAAIGAGAMGEVYRARDADLGREVALKILPESFANDAERVARLRREAQILASLNHPHIAAIHGVTDSASGPALVLELIEGSTVAALIAGTPARKGQQSRGLELERSLDIARQIADALEAAHEKGIVHRDLKPANIKMRPDGTVKVLDFGIAKATERKDAPFEVTETAMATLTGPGVLIGTLAYMSPEQVRGEEATRRSDVWAFGVILFEMLSGQRPFDGATKSDVLAAILQTTPDWSALPSHAPPGLRRLVQRCLERDPKARLHDIGDARLEIEDAIEALTAAPETIPSPLPGVRVVPSHGSRRLLFGLATMAALAAVAATAYFLGSRGATPAAEEIRLQMPPPAGTRFASVPAVSPDGRQIVFVTVPAGGGVSRLWLRRLAGAEPTVLAGTEGASYPFWSPNGRSVAFFADSSLKRLDVSGGAPLVIAAAPVGRGGLWLEDDAILFAPSQFSPLMRVSAAGGQPVPFTTLAEDESGHRFPQRLPGRQLLYFSTNRTPQNSGTRIISVENPDRAVGFFPGPAVAEYSNGFLLFVQQLPARRLVAQRLSLPSGQLLGDPVDVGRIRVSETFGRLVMSTNTAGVIAFLSPEDLIGQLTWMSRDGRVLETVGAPEVQLGVELSPSQREIATFKSGDIWTLDLARPVPNKVTRGNNRHPIWSPDGLQIVSTYQGRGIGTFDLEVTSASTGSFKTLLESTFNVKALGWTRDGQTIVFNQSADKSLAREIWTIGLRDAQKANPYMQDGAQNLEGQLSPDDRWLAYATDRSGRFEVEVRSFPIPGARHVVSLEGGGHPRWRSDGKELYFLAGNSRLMAVTVTPGKSPQFGKPTQLFEVNLVTHPDRANFAAYEYDVTADGSRFLVNRFVSGLESTMTIIVNWAPSR